MSRSISSIAEEILATTDAVERAVIVEDPVTGQRSPQLDISKVNVSDDDVALFLGGDPAPISKPVVEAVKPVEEVTNKTDNSRLLESLETLVKQLTTLIGEMTTCGTIGVNQGAKTSDPFKDEDKKKKRKKRKLTADEILKRRIR